MEASILADARWCSGNHSAASLVGVKMIRGWARALRVWPSITTRNMRSEPFSFDVPRKRSSAPSMFSQAPRTSCGGKGQKVKEQSQEPTWAHRKLQPNKDPVCTVIRKPNVSNSHVVPKLRGIATTMKTTDNQLMSSRETLMYWADWAATGAKDSHIWEDKTDPNKKNWFVIWVICDAFGSLGNPKNFLMNETHWTGSDQLSTTGKVLLLRGMSTRRTTGRGWRSVPSDVEGACPRRPCLLPRTRPEHRLFSALIRNCPLSFSCSFVKTFGSSRRRALVL